MDAPLIPLSQNKSIIGQMIFLHTYMKLDVLHCSNLKCKQLFLIDFLTYFLQPVRVRNWELQVQFRVSGSTKDLYGDGFAIWYVRDRMQPGDVFGSKDYFSGLAIVADTYSNHNGPHNVRIPF